MMAKISSNGLNVVNVADLTDEQVSNALEIIGNQTDDAIRECIHGTTDDAREFVTLYCAAYEAAHGSVYALP